MHCCQNFKLGNQCVVVQSGISKFTVNISYCETCGSKKHVGSGISDGKKDVKTG